MKKTKKREKPDIYPDFSKLQPHIKKIAEIAYTQWLSKIRGKMDKEDFIQMAYEHILSIYDEISFNMDKKEIEGFITTALKNHFSNYINREIDPIIQDFPMQTLEYIEEKPLFDLNDMGLTEPQREFCELIMSGHNIAEACNLLGWYHAVKTANIKEIKDKIGPKLKELGVKI